MQRTGVKRKHVGEVEGGPQRKYSRRLGPLIRPPKDLRAAPESITIAPPDPWDIELELAEAQRGIKRSWAEVWSPTDKVGREVGPQRKGSSRSGTTDPPSRAPSLPTDGIDMEPTEVFDLEMELAILGHGVGGREYLPPQDRGDGVG